MNLRIMKVGLLAMATSLSLPSDTPHTPSIIGGWMCPNSFDMNQQQDLMFVQAVRSIADTFKPRYRPYRTELLTYFAPLFGKDRPHLFFDYVNSKLHMDNGFGPTMSEDHSTIYIRSADITGFCLKAIDSRYRLNEHLGFGFDFSDKNFSILKKSNVYLIIYSDL